MDALTARLSGLVLGRGGPLAALLVTATALAGALLAPVGLWRPAVAVPLVAVLTVAAASALLPHLPAPPAPGWTGLAVLGLAAGHGVWAALTRAEHVVLRRDAGSYALYTQWISTRHDLPVDAQLAAFGGSAALADPAFRLSSPAFYQVVDGVPGAAGTTAEVVPQFLIGAPAWFSLGWWPAGWTGLLVMPAVASALALLAIGGLAARLAGPRAAPLAVAALGLTQPVLHAARSTYSEPLALLLVAAAGALLIDAVATHRGRVALAAGLLAGLAGLVRVDAVREVALLLPVAALLAVRRHPAARPLVVGALSGLAVAAAFALLMSRPYLGTIAGSLVPLVVGTVLLGGLSLVAVRVARVRRDRGRTARRVPAAVERWLPGLTVAGVAVAGLLLALRPLVLVTRQDPADSGSRVVAGLQAEQGLPVDGGRTYAEDTLTWVAWWVGPVATVLAVAALALAAGAGVRWWIATRRAEAAAALAPDVPPWLGVAVVAAGSALLTLARPGITPDHPWADRRLVPVVLPVVVLAAVVAVVRAARRPAGGPRTGALRAGLTTAGVVALLLPPWLGTAPVAGTIGGTERGQLAAVAAVCAALRDGDAVIGVDGRATNEWTQVVRGVCGRPSASLQAEGGTRSPEAARRVVARTAAAGCTPVLLAASPEGEALLRRLGLEPVEVVDLDTSEDQRLLTRRPDGVQALDVDVWLARPAAAGAGRCS